MKQRIIFVLYISAISLLIWHSGGCKDEITGGGIDKIVFPDSNVSYHDHVEPLFLNACAIPGGCHAGDNPAGGLSLETWLDARERVGIITPRFPEESRLVWAIEGRDPGVPRMPLDRSPLNTNQINGIKTWIREGANNN